MHPVKKIFLKCPNREDSKINFSKPYPQKPLNSTIPKASGLRFGDQGDEGVEVMDGQIKLMDGVYEYEVVDEGIYVASYIENRSNLKEKKLYIKMNFIFKKI